MLVLILEYGPRAVYELVLLPLIGAIIVHRTAVHLHSHRRDALKRFADWIERE